MNDAHFSSRRRTARLDPVPMFFGPTGPGPFALLGLTPGEVDPTRVFQALHARLQQLARHPQCATPAGEEVNLALHAAAAQLSDPAIRRELIRTWGSDSIEDERHGHERVPLGEPAESPVDIERELYLAVGLSGGWNARAMERFAIACRQRGIHLEDAVRAVQRASQSQSRARPGAASLSTPQRVRRRRKRVPTVPRESIESASELTAARAVPRDALILIGIGGFGILFLAAAIILLTPARRPALPGSLSSSESVVSAPLSIPTREPDRSSNPKSEATLSDLESGDPRAISVEISGAMQDLASDPRAAHGRFAQAYDAFGKTWPLMSPDEISSVVSAIVDFCYGASRLETPTASTITRSLHENLAAGKSAVRAAAAAAAISGRLLSERELPRAFLDQIETGATIGEFGSKVESSSAFRVGLERNLNNLAIALATAAPASSDSWKAFVEVRDAALVDRQPARDIATLNALELLLRNSVVPPRDLVRPVGVLAASLSWRPSDELRSALAGWLEDTTVPSEFLTEITRAMVASSAPGVDSTMVLPAGSGPEARSNLRERLAQIWQGKVITTEREDYSEWSRWAETLLFTEAKSDSERLWIAARLSRATLAFESLRAGKSERAAEIMKADASTPPPSTSSALPAIPKPEPGSKALEYAAAGTSVQARLEILRQVQSSGSRPDTLLAEVLVAESARGTPASIRDIARSELRKHASETSVVLATLRQLPMIPETPENAEWVSEVAQSPGAWKKRPKWRDAAQVALLDRAIALFPVSADESGIDAASRDLADSWVERAGEESRSRSSDPSTAIEALETAMASAARSPRGAPAGLSVPEIRRRLAARTEIAPGPLERAVAKQAACVEWTALRVAHERPGDIGAIQRLIEPWNAARRAATSSTEQLLEGEKVMVRLQFLRFGRKEKSS